MLIVRLSVHDRRCCHSLSLSSSPFQGRGNPNSKCTWNSYCDGPTLGERQPVTGPAKPPLARLFIYIVPRMSNSCRTIYLGHWKLGNLLDTVLCLSTFQSHVLCPFKRLRQSHMPTTRGLTICLRRCLPTTRKLMAKEFRSRTPVSASLWSACQLEAKA